MAVQIKKAGAYSAAAGVFVKKTGVYSAVQGMFLKSAGVYQSVLGAAAPALPFFSAALAARRASPSTVRQARIITLGHSWTSGAGSGTDDGRSPGGAGEDMYGLINSIPLSWSEKLCQYLTSSGIATMRNSWIGDQRGPIGAYGLKDLDPGRHIYNTADVTEGTNSSFMGSHPKLIGPVDKEYTFTPGIGFTSFKIWGYWDFSAGSSDTELFVDGVSKIHISAATGSNKWGSFPIAGGSYAYSGAEIKLINRHATRKFTLSGIEYFGPATDTKDVFLTMSGRGGSLLSDLVLSTQEYSVLNAVNKYGCDLLIVQAMVNDANGASVTYANNGGDETVLQNTLNTWKNNMQLIYNKNPSADIVIVGDPDAPTGAATEYIITRFHEAAQQIISTNGRGLFVDLRVPYGTYANSNALGYRHTGDTLHPSELGHDKIGQYMAQVIAASI